MTSRLAKISFVLSVGVLGVAYGIAANHWGYFPNSLAKQAWQQAEAQLTGGKSLPHFFRKVYAEHGTRANSPGEITQGTTLITSMWEVSDGWQPRAKLIGVKGKALHEWRISKDVFDSSNYIHGSYLYPNGDLILNIEYVGTVKVGTCGDISWTLQKGNHHSISRDKNGHIWTPAIAEEKKNYKGIGIVKSETIVEINNEGKVSSEINIMDVIYKNELQRYLFKADRGAPVTTHMNDVEPLPSSLADEYPLFESGDLLVSLRDPSLVLVLDPETKEVKWHFSESISQQHDPDFIGGGWVGIFDNNPDGTFRGTAAGGSRIVSVQPHTDSTRVLFPTERSDPFYTSAGGKWQMLENGNMLLTEARAGRIAEVDQDGSTIWEWIKPPSGDVVAEVLEGTRKQITAEQTDMWDCSNEDFVQVSRSKNSE